MHHIHRSITVEGLTSMIGPLFGALPLTTYAQNIGVVATTRVASRRVVQVAALILLLYGLSPKLGALLVLIPRPVVGAVFLVICGMIATAGLRLLACGLKDDVYLLTTALSLVTLPLATAAQKEWLAALPPTGKLFLGNAVVIAITLGSCSTRRCELSVQRGGEGLSCRHCGLRTEGRVVHLCSCASSGIRRKPTATQPNTGFPSTRQRPSLVTPWAGPTPTRTTRDSKSVG
jgi:hypothetical protein